jgi:hypothetical protein
MTKLKQTVIKKFCGPKQAQKEANAKFMAGELERPQSTSKRAALNITKEDVVLDIENDDEV